MHNVKQSIGYILASCFSKHITAKAHCTVPAQNVGCNPQLGSETVSKSAFPDPDLMTTIHEVLGLHGQPWFMCSWGYPVKAMTRVNKILYVLRESLLSSRSPWGHCTC